MSAFVHNGQGPEASTMLRLDGAVERALERIRELEERLEGAEERARDLDGLLAHMSGGELPPTALLDRVRALEGENADLRRRLSGGREGVERLLAKIRFLEDQR
jgi:predicted RNase H-like nuclease (RuvC/YqgF family)